MKVKLLTKEVIRNLPALYSQDGKSPESVKVAVKFFTPDAQATWYITEGDQEGDDWRFFGLCDLGHGSELGYVMLSQIESVRGQLGLPVERDRHYTGTLAEAMQDH